MRRSSIFHSLSAAALASIMATACSSGQPSPESTGTTGAALAVSSPASLKLPGTAEHLLTPDATTSLQIVNPTADDRHVIYVETTTGADGGTSTNLKALPLDGGAPLTILANLGAAYVVVDESTVFIWNNFTPGFVGQLTIWSEASGAWLASSASAPFFSAASADSRNVVFSTNVDAAAGFGDLVAAGPDRKPTTLLTGTALYGNPSFRASVSFQPSGQPNPSAPGFVNDAYFVTSHQEGSAGPVTISSWDTARWTRRDLLVGAQSDANLALQNWSSDTEGKRIAALTEAGQLEVIPVAGPATAARHVGPKTGTSTFALLGSGRGVVYGDPPAPSETAPPSALFSEDLFDGTTRQLAKSGFGGVYFPWENGALGPTPDGSHILYFATENPSFGFLYSLNIVENGPGASPVAIDATDTATIPADPFTTDSRFVIYVTNVDTNTGIGQLNLWNIAERKAVTVSAAGVSCNALHGSTIVYNDNFDPTAGGPGGVADLKIVEGRSSAPLEPTTLRLAADPIYYLTPDRSRVIYTVTAASDPGQDGVYVHRF